VNSFVSTKPLYDEPTIMWAHAYVVVSTKTNAFFVIKHLSSNSNFGICYLENKISDVLDVPNMVHERIIIINESSSKYKERIFTKFLVHCQWVGTIYLHVI